MVEPFGAIDYTMIHNKAYTETGADSLNMSINSHNSQILRQEIGLNFITDMSKQKILNSNSMMKLKASYVHNKPIGISNVTAALSGQPAGFYRSGPNVSQKLLSLGLEWLTKINDKTNIGFSYNNELSRHYNSHEVLLQFNYKF